MTLRRPVIGVVSHDHGVPRPFGTLPVTGASTAVLDAVAAAGGRPVLLGGPYAADQLDLVDAIVLTGGGDIDPARYGGRGPAEDVDPARDDRELAIVRAALAAGVPVLGLCRGMQVLAVACGGVLATGPDHRIPEGGHLVRTMPGSLIASLIGPVARTSALHHQSVIDPGRGWRVTARSEDGTCEAIEPAVRGRAALGVQWHPELGPEPFGDATGDAVFGWIVAAARGEFADDRLQEPAMAP